MAQPAIWEKDPNEVLDYQFDFAAKTNGTGAQNYLEPGETIQSYTVMVTTGSLIVESISLIKTNTCIQMWARGGTIGHTYRITVYVITSESRIVERSNSIRIIDR